MIIAVAAHYGWSPDILAGISLGQFWFYCPEDFIAKDTPIMAPVCDEETMTEEDEVTQMISAWDKAHPDKAGKGDWFNEIVPFWESLQHGNASR